MITQETSLDEFRELARTQSIDAWAETVVQLSTDPNRDTAFPDLPKAEIQTRTNGRHGRDTMEDAAKLYKVLAPVIERHAGPDKQLKILDFGCGWGRLARFMIQLADPNDIHGADVDQLLIRNCRKYLEPMTFRLIEAGKPLPYRKAMFDVVYSNSVFSHLDSYLHLQSIRQIARILKPGGILIATTLDERMMSDMYAKRSDWISQVTGPTDEARDKFEKTGFVFGKTNRNWADYGITFVSDDWITRNWKQFEIVETIRDKHRITVARRLP